MSLRGKVMTGTQEIHRKLLDAAKKAAEAAYCPYSDFPVGAALLTADGQIYTGCNVENACYTSICAERTALVKAISEGHRKFQAVAVACLKAEEGWPCGFCRQTLCEFGTDLEIIVELKSGSIQTMRLSELLPKNFGPADLPT